MSKYTKKTGVYTNKKNVFNAFELINPTAAGMDVGARSVFVCAGKADGTTETREFMTFTADLLEMIAWLKACGTSSVAMESTGVYWIPVFDLLDQAGLDPVLVNAHHLKSVPGRKTDVQDCQWIQRLHACGLLSGSFRPVGECLELRGYTRQRSKLVELKSSQVNLMHKAMTQMNIQLSQTLSDITGETGMKIIRAIVDGERDPNIFASYRNYRCKSDERKIAKALQGNFRDELILALQQALEAYDFFTNQIIVCERHIEQLLNRWSQDDELTKQGDKQELKRKKKKSKSGYSFDVAGKLKTILKVDLTEVPGFEENTVLRLASEIGTNMSKWPSAKHFASWLRLCPNNKISGGKILSSRTLPSSSKAAQALRIAANTLQKSHTALGAFLRRIRIRHGEAKAITATAHKLAKITYIMLKDKVSFHEIGQAEYERKFKERSIMNMRRKAKDLGFEMVKIAA